ncbi:MAG: serpin family protein [Planctomycetota bacterium]
MGPPNADAGAVSAATKAAAADNNAFACDLYTRLSQQEGNLFFSPFSISTALAMTYAGARDETADQMAKTLHFELNQERLHAAMGDLVGVMNEASKQEGAELIVANALWGQEGFKFLDDFLKVNREHYAAGLRQVNFAQTEQARQTINAWVADQTRNLIPELLPAGVLDAMTRLVLTNAIYFKGKWLHEFKPKRTKDLPFTTADGTEVQTPMMRQTEDAGYAEGKTWQAVSLPYMGRELSMVVVLPKAKDGLAKLEKAFTADFVAGKLARLRRQEVALTLPKFKLESRFSLGKVLAAMGMPLAFDQAKADFSGMTGRSDLYISAVVHKAVVEVNEEGTEAAAATGVVMTLKAMPRPPKVFKADHPFLFFIRHEPTGSILFLGRVADPTA